MNELITFQFGKDREVRTLERDGEPWFVHNDVCNILGIQNSRDVWTKQLDEDEKGVEKIYSPGGYQDTNIINESGLYNLIFRSNKPEAKRFRKWVTSEVLPAIRKTGAYSILKGDYESLQNVYHQMENYRMKYISLLDKLEERGMKIREIWELSGVDRSFLIEYRQKMIADTKAYREGGEWGRQTVVLE
jgi:prophage antirepressor-like protein